MGGPAHASAVRADGDAGRAVEPQIAEVCGRALDAGVHGAPAPWRGTRLGRVRVHDDPLAGALSRAVEARALTTGLFATAVAAGSRSDRWIARVAGERVLARTIMAGPAGHLVWEDSDSGATSALDPVAPGQDLRGVDRRWLARYGELYLAVELEDRGLIPLIGRTHATDMAGSLIALVDAAVGRGGDLAVMRSAAVVAGDYYWSGDKAKGLAMGLDAARFWSYDWGWLSSWYGWAQVASGGGVRLFKRRANLGRRLTPPKQATRKKQKGASARGQGPGVGVTAAGARGSPKVAMGGRTAQQAALHAGRGAGERYEWCHLIGHGEGGQEHVNNLVAATHFANTEQLAVEQAFRAARRRHGLHAVGMKVTAYTVPGFADVADSIRYKLIDSATGRVIVDWRIDGASQRFDLADFRVLQATVEERIDRHFGP